MVSKRLRHEVMRRDNHTCRYCGASAPDVRLTIDHVVPTTLGGSDDPSNLVTACADCNAGKSSIAQDAAIVEDVHQDALRWRAAIYLAGSQASRKRKHRDRYVQDLDEKWSEWRMNIHVDGAWKQEFIPRPAGWKSSVWQWYELRLPISLLKDCVDLAAGNDRIRPDDTWRYMAGCAWKKVRELQDRARVLLDEGSV